MTDILRDVRGLIKVRDYFRKMGIRFVVVGFSTRDRLIKNAIFTGLVSPLIAASYFYGIYDLLIITLFPATIFITSIFVSLCVWLSFGTTKISNYETAIDSVAELVRFFHDEGEELDPYLLY